MDDKSLIQNLPCCGQTKLASGENPEDPEFWGPLLWKILYFLIYKINSTKNIEKLLVILDNLDKVLPCTACNNHVNQYKTREPLIKIENNTYSSEEILLVKLKIFLWIRKLQNIIRFNHKKEVYNFTIESLEDYYKNVNITQNSFRSIYSIFAFSNNGLQRNIRKEIKDWLRILEELKMEILG
jgi:hypothetical protein